MCAVSVGKSFGDSGGGFVSVVMKIISITDPSQLDVLQEMSAVHGAIHFSFSADYLLSLKNALQRKHAYQIFLQNEENIIGYMGAAETLWSEYLTIIELFVPPSFQGKGVGKTLISHAIDFAKKEQLKGLVVQTEQDNIPAQALYKQKGFEVFENKDWKGLSYKLTF